MIKMIKNYIAYFVLVISAFMIYGCDSSGALSSNGNNTVTKLEIIPESSITYNGEVNVEIVEGRGANIQAMATYNNGVVEDITNLVNWSLSNNDTASIEHNNNNEYYVSALQVGDSILQANYQGIDSNEIKISVLDKVIDKLTIIPLDSRRLKVAESKALSLSISYSNGDNTTIVGDEINDAGINWNIESCDNRIGKIEILNSSQIVGIQDGINCKFYASINDIVSPTLAVDVTGAILTSIKLVNNNSNQVPLGLSVDFKAIGFYADNTSNDITNAVTWRSSDDNIATFYATSPGRLIGNNTGVVNVSAEFESINSDFSDSADDISITFVNSSISKVSLYMQDNSNSATIMDGNKDSLKIDLLYSDGTQKSITDFSSSDIAFKWVVDQPNIIEINDKGEIVALNEGIANVSVIADGISSLYGDNYQVNITVTAPEVDTLKIYPKETNDVIIGIATELVAVAKFTDGTVADVTNNTDINWAVSRNNSNASVSSNGIVSGLQAGDADITATINNISEALTVNVLNPDVNTLNISIDGSTGNTLNIAKGNQGKLKAEAVFSDNSNVVVTDQVIWKSSDINVAYITNNGTVIGNNEGTVQIKAQRYNLDNSLIESSEITVNVTNAIVTSVFISNAELAINVGESEQLTVFAVYSDNSVENITGSSSINYNIADTQSNKISINYYGLLSVDENATTTITPITITATYMSVTSDAPQSLKLSVNGVDYLEAKPLEIYARAGTQSNHQLIVFANFENDSSKKYISNLADYNISNDQSGKIKIYGFDGLLEVSNLATATPFGDPIIITVTYGGKTAKIKLYII